MEQVTFNLYPIFKIFVVLFAVVGAYATINNFLHILGRFGKDKLDNKKDIHAKDCDADIIQDLIQQMNVKYPDVKNEFILLPEREQNIENNQEIQTINETLREIKATISEIRSTQRGGL